MNRTAAAALCVVLWAMAVSADEAFLLNIPLRMNASQETGEVRGVPEGQTPRLDVILSWKTARGRLC